MIFQAWRYPYFVIGFFLAMGVGIIFLNFQTIVEIVLALLHIGFVQEPYHAPVMFAVLVLADMVAAIVLPRNRKHVLCEDRVEVAEIFDRKTIAYCDIEEVVLTASKYSMGSDMRDRVVIVTKDGARVEAHLFDSGEFYEELRRRAGLEPDKLYRLEERYKEYY